MKTLKHQDSAARAGLPEGEFCAMRMFNRGMAGVHEEFGGQLFRFPALASLRDRAVNVIFQQPVSSSPMKKGSPMNSLSKSLARPFAALTSFLLITAFWMQSAVAQSANGVVAEVWPLERPVEVSASRAFEVLRAQTPSVPATTLQLDKLEIPDRENPSLVRVCGVLIPPQSGRYTIQISGTDEAEFWLEDAESGWKRVQRTGNPNTGKGRIKLEQGAARRFEFWTMGRKEISVQWESEIGLTPAPVVPIAKQPIPASSMGARVGKEGDRNGNGLRDEWKQRWGLDPNSGDGPNGPWGDPDGDGLMNWKEQMAGTNPKQADAEGRAGLVRWELWRNVPGKYVFDLTRSAKFAQHPDESGYLHRLEIPVGNGDDYGSRMRALVKAPASGEYTFSIISNDTAELWLGETESWQSRRLIARVEQDSAQSRWTRGSKTDEKPLFPEQVSARITLQEGTSYYVEVLHKQAGKEDHCSVAWLVPGATSPQVIGAESLISWQRNQQDADDDGLPDTWQASLGLKAEGVDPGMRTAYADPDHDGRTNWEEWKAGTNPLQAEAVSTTQMLKREIWDGVLGKRIKDLVLNPAYPANPSHSTLVDNMDFSDEGDAYGVRLRGYLTAPDDGPYIFYISGNDACRLYLAESEDKFGKRLIAETGSGTGWRAYGRNASQQSARIELRKGQTYYIEVLFKRGALQGSNSNQRDHSSVAWKRPGRAQTVIDAEFFSPYQKNTRDGDDDDLPDDWESGHGLDPNDPNGANGAWGDPDGDGLENLREYQAGLDPKAADVHGARGFTRWEYWEGIRGNLPELKSHPSFPKNPTGREWVTELEGSANFGDYYGSRLRAFVIPPATGTYLFAIAGDNECELWLSSSEQRHSKELVAFVKRWTGQRQWFAEPGQVSHPIRMEAGKRYFIEALHKEDTKHDHLSVGWKVPGSNEFAIISGMSLAGYDVADPNDANDNDLPDDWETANRLPAGSSGDNDADGDGLTNRQEFIAGTNPTRVDTDGDGVGDFDEIHLYRSNPVVKDTSPPVKLADIPLGGFQAAPGSWFSTPDGVLHSVGRRGAVDLAFKLEKPGIYLIELHASAQAQGSYIPSIPVIARVDGIEVGRAEVKAGGSQDRWLTPLLAAGDHKVAIDNRNVRSGATLDITSLVIFQYEGADQNGNAIPDWMDQILRQNSHFAETPAESATSPVCIEGTARFAADVKISGPAGEVSVNAGLAGHWFANVPLDPVEETKITASFEHGTLHEESTVRWVATNIFESPDTIRVRVGDSLKVTAVPSGTDVQNAFATVTLDEERLDGGSEPRIVTFDQPGTFTLAAIVSAGAETIEASVRVDVITADFGPAFSLASGTPRVWDLPDVPHSLTVEADPDLRLEEMDREPPDSRRFTVRYPAGRSASPRVLARLSEDGPIVAATSINAFWFAPASATGNHKVVRTLRDGTRIVEVRYVITGPIPPDLSIWLHLHVTDALFANGDTWYRLKASDFDANGEARLYIYKAPGTGAAFVCHGIHPFLKETVSH